jgi:hypothetical protein
MTSAIKKTCKSVGSFFMAFPLCCQPANGAVTITIVTQETNTL